MYVAGAEVTICEYLSLLVMVRIPCLRVLVIAFNLLFQTKMRKDEASSREYGAASTDDDDAHTDYSTALTNDSASPIEEGDSKN